jgi:hypothetical protein
MAIISPSTNQISPANERMYGLSRLVGEWKGKWTGKNQEVAFKVVNIRGARAQVEYTHNGRTERGIGKVENGTITFGGVMIGTKDGKTAALMFSAGGIKSSALLDKQAPPADDNNLIGSWGGHSSDSNGTASFKVISVKGKEAEVSTTINGETRTGTGIVYKNVIMFGKTQISTNDGKTGNLIFQVGLKSFAVPITKYPPVGSSSSVDKLA